MKKAFQKISSDGFCLGNICFGVKGASAHAEVEKNILHVKMVISGVFIFNTFGLQPSSKPVRMLLALGSYLSASAFLYVHPSNDILQFHCSQPVDLLFLSNDTLYDLCFNSVKVPCQVT